MTKKSIKVVIAGRSYPLTIKEVEESTVLESVNKINDNIKRLQENYAVKDMQDLLAMTSLQLATKVHSSSDSSNNESTNKVDKSEVIDALILLSNSIEE